MTAAPRSVPLASIDDCFQGSVPASICSVASDGTPNITFLSIVHRLGDTHVGLSRQFFSKTTANLMAIPRAQIEVVDPATGRQYRLDVEYERTEDSGQLFEYVRARLDAIASHTGMTGIFKLASVDVCRVLACTAVPDDFDTEPAPRPRVDLALVETASRKIAAAANGDELVTIVLDYLVEQCGYEHAIFLLADEQGERLYTVGSRGYAESGAGSEVRLGDGIIGVSGERRQSINLGNIPAELTYSRTARERLLSSGGEPDMEREIPLPGLANAISQLAVPVEARGRLYGVICLQSEAPGRFGSDDEAIVKLIAGQTGLVMSILGAQAATAPSFVAEVTEAARANPAVRVRHYAEDDSVFIDTDYLIKGVAGRVLWRLLRSYSDEKRVEFTNKEMRLDPTLDLPDIKDNLEARLILLRRRLEDRCDFLRIANTGRGRFRLLVQRDFTLQEGTESTPG